MLAGLAGADSSVSAFETTNHIQTMGDKSPKAKQKVSSQKQVKASSASQAKKPAGAAKPAAPKK